MALVACGIDAFPNSTHYKLPLRRHHVLFIHLCENWGALSEEIVNKTGDWVPNMTEHWMEDECTREQILRYLNHPDVKAIVTTQHQIWRHDKEGIEIRNTHSNGDFHGYYMGLRHSKFILSPSGMGLNCYRHYEAMLMGAIPVIQHLYRTERDGWFRTLEDLPVALIDSYDNLTPQWLDTEYRRIIARPLTSYKFEKLTTGGSI